MADPFGTIRRVYDFLDMELRPDVLTRMKDWHTKNRSGAHGTHRYTAEQFGLSVAQIRSDFAHCIERYGIDPET